MKKLILSLFAGLFLFSCGVTKTRTRTDKSEGNKTVEERVVTRPGDTLTIDIPNIRYKDTTITRVNYENRTVATVRYDSEGNQTFECLSAELREEFRLMREQFKNDVDEDSETTAEFNPQHLIYAIAVLAGIVLIMIVVVFVIYTKMKKDIPNLINNIVRS